MRRLRRSHTCWVTCEALVAVGATALGYAAAGDVGFATVYAAGAGATGAISLGSAVAGLAKELGLVKESVPALPPVKDTRPLPDDPLDNQVHYDFPPSAPRPNITWP